MTRWIALFLTLCAGPAFGQQIVAAFPNGSTSVVLRVPLFDATDPTICPSGTVDNTSTGLTIKVSSDVTNGLIDSYVAGTDLQAITTIGTYEAPSASNARFERIVAGSCMFEIHFLNSIYATASATYLSVEITDGGTLISDAAYIVDLGVVDQETLIDNFFAEVLSTYTTAGTAGNQLGAQLTNTLNAANAATSAANAAPAAVCNQIVESGGAVDFSICETLSLYLAEAFGGCTASASGWTCNDTSGTEVRFTLSYGANPGDRSASEADLSPYQQPP